MRWGSARYLYLPALGVVFTETLAKGLVTAAVVALVLSAEVNLVGELLEFATSCAVCLRFRTVKAVWFFCLRSQRRWRRRLEVSSGASIWPRVVLGDRAAL